MTAFVLVAGLTAVGIGGLVAGARTSPTAGVAIQAAGAAAVGVAGYWAFAGGTSSGAAFTSSFAPSFGVDPLTAFFLAVLGTVALPALVFSLRSLRPTAAGRAVGALTAAFVLCLAALFCARDPLTFLAAWELMTLVPAAVVLVAHGADARSRRTVFTYLAITHLAGAATWVAVLLLAQVGAIGGDGSALETGSGLQVAVALAALVGMGAKAGLMPLHVWLPRAHPMAPAPVSALMSGVMIKAAVYGLVRILVDWAGVLPVWIGVLVLAVGAVSAVAGIVYALFQRDLKRLLALSSIENVGIVALGLGACLVLRARGAEQWAAIALAAALLHTLNHAVFKGLLFLGAGALQRMVGSLELDRLGGLLRRMPWTGGAFLVGAAAIAGLPPLNGFASEWLALQALLRVPVNGEGPDGLAGGLALAALAATAALAVLCFVKVVGLVLLGAPRREAVAEAAEAPLPMRLATGFLALACVVLGLVPGLLLAPLVALAPWPAEVPDTAGLALPSTGSLPTPGIALALVLGTALLLALRGRRVAAPAPTWACGQAVEPRLAWTGAGFAKPLRLVLEAVLRPERELTVRAEGGVIRELTFRSRLPSPVEERLYAPAERLGLAAARHARKVQSGRLGAYVAYLSALVLVLLAGARLGVIG